ncbi:hypothetical protein L873DRAFT_1760160 [Choiromyces venosus 120613-1]|uniref:Uncharacterized protein n=1 Tax=Choiromyces venosus 120613-1 TaxID=1336337 RepID=A0A3N4KCT3_9PEZI|nr:hypothetical protein L873DRAFT_1760160 [Choiromyces venosus 120613-1]
MIDVTASSPSPSLSSHDSDSDDDDEQGDAEAEWQESLQQLELLLSMVLVPFIGKWVGRKCAYIAWGKFMTWKYPVEVVVTDKVTFSIVGMVGAVSPPL